MTVNKRKKVSRYRGSMTHGWGAKKKHRGSGNRGGKGMAGSGKRSDSKKPSLWKYKYFGKYGFVSKNTRKINAININYLEDNIEKLPQDILTKEGDFFSINLEKLGFNKLLSSGKVTNKYKIKVLFASKKAVEKIKSNGGEIISK
ncbi:MAG: uL15 family ribosomal protein [Nanoarchaeota archaeon]|nr:uL15 family ribosomal protein [Nanoarchaeota archaeon]